MKKAAFLDRDGVINESVLIDGIPTPPKNIEEVRIIEGVIDAIKILKNHDFTPIVITNQPDVARGTRLQKQIEEINSYIGQVTGIEYFYTCFHDDYDFCSCRKPLPGMIYQSSFDLGIDLTQSFVVGDRWRDIEAGQAVGCFSFFIDYLYPEKMPREPYTRVASLLEATQIVVRGLK